MIRLHTGGRSFLVGTEAGCLLLRYAAALADSPTPEPVGMQVIDERGALEYLVVPAGGGVGLAAEVTDEDFGPEPENAQASGLLRERLAELAGDRAA